jgi:hypothetical protein
MVKVFELHIPGNMLNTLHALSNLILSTALKEEHYY